VAPVAFVYDLHVQEITYTRESHFFVVLKGVSLVRSLGNSRTEFRKKLATVFIKFGDSKTPRILMEAYLLMLGSWAYIGTFSGRGKVSGLQGAKDDWIVT